MEGNRVQREKNRGESLTAQNRPTYIHIFMNIPNGSIFSALNSVGMYILATFKVESLCFPGKHVNVTSLWSKLSLLNNIVQLD